VADSLIEPEDHFSIFSRAQRRATKHRQARAKFTPVGNLLTLS
jgi:hypothetical protein